MLKSKDGAKNISILKNENESALFLKLCGIDISLLHTICERVKFRPKISDTQ